MSSGPNPLALLNYALWAGVIYVISYMVLAFGLSLLGARVRQRSTWLAWIPLFNFYLMCRLAQVSALLIFPLLIPLLNLLVFAYLGARIAKRFGRSPALGALFGVPVLGNAIPLVLGLSRKTEAEQAAPAPANPPLVSALIHAGVVCTIVILPPGIWTVAHHFSRATAPAASVQQAAAALPPRIAGTMVEFPVDSAPTDRALPSDLTTTAISLPEPGEKPRTAVSSSMLPPWMKPEAVAAYAESATTANYNTIRTTNSIAVVNLALRPGATEPAPPTAKELAAIDPAATSTPVELKSANNVTYRGYRVNAPDSVYYSLHREDTNSLMLISTTNDAGNVAVANRLASNIGNGGGLLEDEAGRSGVALVPAAPSGTKLVRMETATTAQIDLITARLNDDKVMAELESKENEKEGTKGMAKVFIPIFRAMMPKSYTLAAFATPAKDRIREEDYAAAVAGFASNSDAWTALQATRALVEVFTPFAGGDLHIEVRNVEIEGHSGIVIDTSQDEVKQGDRRIKDAGSFSAFVLRQDNYLLGFGSFNSVNSTELRPWVENYFKARQVASK